MSEIPLNVPVADEAPLSQELKAETAQTPVDTKTPAKTYTVGELASLLVEIRDANVKQAKSQRLRTVFMGVFALAVVVIAVALIGALWNVMPRLEATIDDLNTVTSNLTKIDIVKIADEISALAVTGTNGINEALTALDTTLKDASHAIGALENIDIDGLNKSIKDLGAVIGPLAKLFGN